MRSLSRQTLLFLLLLSVVTCKKENRPPTIVSITASPQTIKTRVTTQLTCIAKDSDGDKLTYFWYSLNTVYPNGREGSTIWWKAPDELGNYNFSVIVSDGEETVQGSVTVSVEVDPQLSVTPTDKDFGTIIIQQSFDITNIGTGTLTWNISENFPWLTLDNYSGSTTTETDQVTATVDRSVLVSGGYEGTITITSGGGNQDIIVSVKAPEEIPGTFIDSRDGHEYNYIKIGDQIWMAENLAYLPEVSPPSELSVTEPQYCVYDYYGTNVSEAKATDNYNTFGVLYNWKAAMEACPEGWHLPTDDEWKQLEMFVGLSQSEADDTGNRGNDEGAKLKATSGWFDYNGTDAYGFSGLRGGLNTGNFTDIGSGCWWCSDGAVTEDHAYYRRLRGGDCSWIVRLINDKENGCSVRCVKD